MGVEAVTWLSDRRLEAAGRTFTAATSPAGLADDEFLIIKPPELVHRYLDLIEAEQPSTIVELGVKDGGSTALLALVAEPDQLLAVDLAPSMPPILGELIADLDHPERVATAFGLDQSDRAALTAAVDACLGTRPIDLVIDDASHVLGPTRASFEVLYPRAAPGGLFVVEDWSSEVAAIAHLAKALPELDDLDDRVEDVLDVLHILNAPDRELPPAVQASMTEVAQRPRPEGAAPPPTSLFALLLESAAQADLSALPPRASRVRPLADLAVELTMIAAVAPDVVASVEVDAHWIAVRRGPAELPTDGFRLDQHWGDPFGYLR